MSHNTVPVNVTTLTPVHIGSGNELRGNFEYLFFQKESQIAVIEPKRVFDIIGEENLAQWVAIIDNNQNLLDYLRQRKPTVTAADVAQRIISIYGKAPDADKNAIKEQIHLADNNPTIPGSSFKGSIRTAILTKLIMDDPDFVQAENHLGSRKGKYMDYHARQIEANYFGKDDRTNRYGEIQQSPNKDLLRFLRLGDAYFPTGTCVVRNTIINQFHHGWGEKKEESSYYECIPTNATTTSTIQIPKEMIEQVMKKNYLPANKFNLLSIQRLFKLINEHTHDLIQREIDFWKTEDEPLAIGDHLERFQEIQKAIKACEEDTCILRVGAGSGWKFMTGGWAAGKDRMGDYILENDVWADLKNAIREDYKKDYADDTPFPKTRKMIEGGEPLGFVKLSL